MHNLLTFKSSLDRSKIDNDANTIFFISTRTAVSSQRRQMSQHSQEKHEDTPALTPCRMQKRDLPSTTAKDIKYELSHH